MPPRQHSNEGSNSAWTSRKYNRHNSMTEIDGKDNYHIPGTPSFINPATPARERRKFVSFTVELLREGGPLGINIGVYFFKSQMIIKFKHKQNINIYWRSLHRANIGDRGRCRYSSWQTYIHFSLARKWSRRKNKNDSGMVR